MTTGTGRAELRAALPPPPQCRAGPSPTSLPCSSAQEGPSPATDPVGHTASRQASWARKFLSINVCTEPSGHRARGQASEDGPSSKGPWEYLWLPQATQLSPTACVLRSDGLEVRLLLTRMATRVHGAGDKPTRKRSWPGRHVVLCSRLTKLRGSCFICTQPPSTGSITCPRAWWGLMRPPHTLGCFSPSASPPGRVTGTGSGPTQPRPHAGECGAQDATRSAGIGRAGQFLK